MVEARFIEQGPGADHRAGAGLPGGKDDRGDAGMDQRAAAHGAGLEGDVENAAGQAVIAALRCCRAQRIDLCVRRRVGAADLGIGALTDDAPILDQHRADGHLTARRRLPGQLQGSRHGVAVPDRRVTVSRPPGRVGFVHMLPYAFPRQSTGHGA